jgi:hypothetical protein
MKMNEMQKYKAKKEMERKKLDKNSVRRRGLDW